MKEMVKMIVVLSLICGLSGFTLAALRQSTLPLIEEQVLTYVQNPALQKILAGCDNDPIKDRKKFTLPGTDNQITVFPGIKNGKLFGVALETSGKGYGGNIGVMVAFSTKSDSLTGIGITTMKETPGVGTRVTENGFTDQFKNHPLNKLQLSSKGGDIDAVAGATISSTGTTDAVQDAVKIYRELKPELDKTWS